MGFENVPQQYTFGDDFFVDPARATSVNTFPKQIESEVSQYAFDVYEIRAGQPIQLDFSGTTKTPLVENILPASGKFFWWSGRANQSDMSLTRAVDLSGLETATLNYSVFHSLELGYDFAYVLVSKDEGKSWETLTTPNMQGNKPEHNPADAALTKRFYTGRSKGWMDESIDLSRYAGRKILIRFQVVTDAVFTAPGLVVDNIAIPEIGFTDDVETLAEGWETQGFLRLSAYAPQRFDLLLITFEAGDKPSVQRIALSGDNTAALDISLAEGNNRALLIVAASTPLLLTPASYQLSFRAP
jgi:bacillopeptidase F (M6 metalloprotease family)